MTGLWLLPSGSSSLATPSCSATQNACSKFDRLVWVETRLMSTRSGLQHRKRGNGFVSNAVFLFCTIFLVSLVFFCYLYLWIMALNSLPSLHDVVKLSHRTPTYPSVICLDQSSSLSLAVMSSDSPVTWISEICRKTNYECCEWMC